MCGISAVLDIKGQAHLGIEAANRRISHRGPDDEGFAIFPQPGDRPIAMRGEATADKGDESGKEHINDYRGRALLALGHRRLSILDLSAFGHQPMQSPDGRYTMVYNGEVYNYLELRAELEDKGYTFKSTGDSEVLLTAYSHWGREAFARMQGMWSVLIYDRYNQSLFGCRDRFGIKPMYYSISNKGRLILASEIKQFFAYPDVVSRLNHRRSMDFLVYSMTDHTDETLFSGIFQVPAGHSFELKVKDFKPKSGDRIPCHSWYSINYDPINISIEDAAVEFDNLFERSVSEHLRADVAVGSALSGGLDSSAVVSRINTLSRGIKDFRQATFSSCSRNERYDERKWIDVMVDRYKVEPHYTYMDPGESLQLVGRMAYQQDEPYQSQSIHASYQVMALASSKGVKVLLNGQGADEYLGGYGQFNNLINLAHLRNGRIADLKANLTQPSAPSAYTALMKTALLKYSPGPLTRLLRKQSSYYGDIKSLLTSNSDKSQHPYEAIDSDPHSVNGVAAFQLWHSPLPRYLRWEDRNSMAHSLEARVPFLDHRLIEFCLNLPNQYLVNGGFTKFVMRKALDKHLPSSINWRKDKMGYITAEQEWSTETNVDNTRQLLKHSIEIAGEILSPRVLSYYDQMLEGKRKFDYTYWRMISFAAWAKEFNVKLS